jgi:hypothetical protein
LGRSEELRLIEQALVKGSVAIQGPMGTGKSSLLTRIRLLMEGKPHGAKPIIAVGDKDVKTVDEAARLLLQAFVQARLVRSLTMHAQQNGVKNLRFLLAGVSPFFQALIKEDAGVNRCISLKSMACWQR